VETPCSEKSAKSELRILDYVFMFFEMPLQKNVKSLFFGFSKKHKIRILELWFELIASGTTYYDLLCLLISAPS